MNIIQSRERLRKLIEDKCLIRDRTITLSTGAQSNFYFDCKAVTLDGEGLSLMAQLILEKVKQFSPQPVAIGGLTMGADFITAAVVMKAFESGAALVHGSIVRKEPKKHGTRNKIENQLPPGTPIVVVDDVITTGKSTKQACEEFIESGYKIVGIIAMVDRKAGGRESLEAQFGPPVTSLFSKDDFPSLSDGHEHSDAQSRVAQTA
jgi:orotate phosphoribosyltransferase